MRVIFNVDAITAPLTGIGRYALELARGLARHAAIEELRLYSAYRWVDDPAHALAANRTIAAMRRNVPFKTQALELYTQLRGALFRLHTRKHARLAAAHAELRADAVRRPGADDRARSVVAELSRSASGRARAFPRSTPAATRSSARISC